MNSEVAPGNEEFQQAIRRAVPLGWVFKGFPQHHAHASADLMCRALLEEEQVRVCVLRLAFACAPCVCVRARARVRVCARACERSPAADCQAHTGCRGLAEMGRAERHPPFVAPRHMSLVHGSKGCVGAAVCVTGAPFVKLLSTTHTPHPHPPPPTSVLLPPPSFGRPRRQCRRRQVLDICSTSAAASSFALRVKVFAYPEGRVSVWLMLAVKLLAAL